MKYECLMLLGTTCQRINRSLTIWCYKFKRKKQRSKGAKNKSIPLVATKANVQPSFLGWQHKLAILGCCLLHLLEPVRINGKMLREDHWLLLCGEHHWHNNNAKCGMLRLLFKSSSHIVLTMKQRTLGKGSSTSSKMEKHIVYKSHQRCYSYI
jgi:hypothetical protein